MFKQVKKATDSRTKKKLIELAGLYSRIVETFLEQNNYDTKVNSEMTSVIARLKDLNIIEEQEDLALLKKTLKHELYARFIQAVELNVKFKRELRESLLKLDPNERKKLQEKAEKSNAPRIIDFFSGAGGLSLGFIHEGFHVDLANDYEEVCVDTYRYNHPDVPEERVIHGDIREIVNHIEDYVKNDIDVVVGGPPCQGFSSANQQRIIDDPRNELYKYFIRAVEKIAPKFVVMENVRGMLPYAEQVIEDYKRINISSTGKGHNYVTSCKVLISDDFGVAQKRQRLIFIAIRDDVAQKNKISPELIFSKIDKSNQNKKRHVLNDALSFIKPLDAPRVKNMTEVDDELTGKKVDLNQFTGKENSYLKLINSNRKIDFVFNHKARYTNDINYEIYGTLDQGEDGTSEKIKHVMPYQHRNHIFKDKYFKLIADKPSRTITAHLRMDCHSHIHPFQVRSITPREAARIQSFPDDYVFLGAYLKTYMQIGNAVPPMMARGIAQVLKGYV